MKKLLFALVIVALVSCNKNTDNLLPVSPASLQFKYNATMVKYGTINVSGSVVNDWYTIMGTRNDTTLTICFRANGLKSGDVLTLNSTNSTITYRAGMNVSVNDGVVVTLSLFSVNSNNAVSGSFTGNLYNVNTKKVQPLTEGQFINLVFR
jgi:hypothetical protein